MSRSTQDRLVRQARLQTETEAEQQARPSQQDQSRASNSTTPEPRRDPAPDPGDVFFDFEGDPLHTEDGVHWGLDYLFGLVDDRADFTAFWAHTSATSARR